MRLSRAPSLGPGRAPARRGPPRGRRRARFGRALGASAAGALALALAGAAALAVQLSRGPLSLEPLRPALEVRAGDALGDARLTMTGLWLESAGGDAAGGPVLRLDGVRVVDGSGRTLFAAPRTRVALSATALLGGRLRPVSVEVAAPAARLTREPSGRFQLGLAGDGPDAPGGEDEAAVAGLIDALAQGAPGPLSALREITVTNARLRYDDLDSGRVWRAERADLRVTRGPEGLRGVASLTLPGGAQGPTALRAEGVRAPDGGARLRLGFSGAATRDLVDQFPALAGLEALQAPIQGRAEAAIDGAGRLTAFDATLRAAPGAVEIAGARTAFHGGEVAFALDPATRRFDIRRLSARLAHGALEGTATVAPTLDARGAPVGLTAQLDLDALTVAPPGLFAAPARFDAATATVRATLDPLRIEVAQAHLARGGLRLDATGAAALRDGAWEAEATLTGRDADAADIVALWPLAAAPGARRWLVENLDAGRVDRFEIAARAGPGGERLGLTFSFRDGRAHYLRPLPPIDGAAGWGEATLERFDLALDAGTVTAPDGGTIDLAGSSMAIPDLDDPLSTSVVAVAGAGPLPAVLAVLDMPPLGFPGALGLDPASVRGGATATAALTLPLLRDLLLEQVEVSVDARLTDLDMRPPGIDARLTAAAATLEADVRGLRAAGDARLDGAPLRFAWIETFSPAPGAPRSSFDLAAQVSAQRLAALGFDPRPHLDGTLAATGSVALFDGGRADVDMALDLGGAALSAAPLAWRKAAGAAAEARIVARRDPSGAVAASRLSLDAPGLRVEGALDVDAGGALRRAALSRLRLGDTVDMALELRLGPDGVAAEATGALFDLAALDGADGGGPDGGGRDGGGRDGGGPPVALALSLDTLRLDPRVALRRATGRATRDAAGVVSARLQGDLGAAAVAIDFDGDLAAGGRLRLSADDAGEALRAAGLFPDGAGGAMSVEAEASLDPLTLSGQVAIDGMTIVDDPALRAMLARAETDEARAGGVRFDTIRAPFRLTAQTLTLDEAVAYGPTVGLSVSGRYDLPGDRLDVEGVFSPAFALNSAVGAIPLLGQVLTGGEGRGVIAFNFRVRGPAAEPVVTVNPLSVLTPGVLRRLFERDFGPPRPAMDYEGADFRDR